MLATQVNQHPRHHGQPGDDQQVDAQPQDDQLQAGSAKSGLLAGREEEIYLLEWIPHSNNEK